MSRLFAIIGIAAALVIVAPSQSSAGGCEESGRLALPAFVPVAVPGGCVSNQPATIISESCGEATPIDPASPHGFPEVVGVATDASLYGLVFLQRPLPIRAGDDVKIVWRMTGSGALSIEVVDPAGRERELTFGPEPHTGSNYDRPGDEWAVDSSSTWPGAGTSG